MGGHLTHCAVSQAVTGSQRDAANGRLDATLAQLATAIDPQAAASRSSSNRVERIELAIAHLQVARILAHKQHPKQQQQHQSTPGDAIGKSTAAVNDLDTAARSANAATAEVRMIAKLLGVDAGSRWVNTCSCTRQHQQTNRTLSA